MRNGSLLIDIRGKYHWQDFKNFEILAKMFGVFFKPVQTKDLLHHSLEKYEIKEHEINTIVNLIHEYLNEKPYKFNLI
jgi:hypothetical protein